MNVDIKLPKSELLNDLTNLYKDLVEIGQEMDLKIDEIEMKSGFNVDEFSNQDYINLRERLIPKYHEFLTKCNSILIENPKFEFGRFANKMDKETSVIASINYTYGTINYLRSEIKDMYQSLNSKYDRIINSIRFKLSLNISLGSLFFAIISFLIAVIL